jgi:hypothetical protein
MAVSTRQGRVSNDCVTTAVTARFWRYGGCIGVWYTLAQDPRSEPSAITGLGLWFLEMRGCWLGSFNHLATKTP